MARSKVPEAGFVRADIAHVPFADGVFDAVVAFYSIIHVPRDEHVGLMANVYRVLRPGGILVATMGGVIALTLWRRIGWEYLCSSVTMLAQPMWPSYSK